MTPHHVLLHVLQRGTPVWMQLLEACDGSPVCAPARVKELKAHNAQLAQHNHELQQRVATLEARVAELEQQQ